MNAPSRPNRSTPAGTAIRRSNPTVAEPFCAKGFGSATRSAVHATVGASGVPPVRLVTRIGIAAQVPCQLSHSRRYTSVSATAEALVNDTDSCPVHVAPDASLDRVTA